MKPVKELTAQQIFNKVAMHLAKQGKKAITGDGSCINFTKSELRCAVGCLVPRSFYRKPENRDYRVGGLGSLETILPRFGVPYGTNNPVTTLLTKLVILHDDIEVDKWKEGLLKIAEDFKLTAPDWLQLC